MIRAAIREAFRQVAGDTIATWVHAFRFAYFAVRGRSASPFEVDMALIPRFLHLGEVAIDIGANGADWTARLSRQVGPNGHVYAFEADPYFAAVTARTIRLLRLRNVTLFPFGLGDVRETATLVVRDAMGMRVSGTSFIDKTRQEVSPKDECVQLHPLDELTKSVPRLSTARLIKCDVEGFELMVFRGACQLLENARPVIILEFGGGSRHGYSDEELLRFFRDRNYACHVCGPPPYNLIPYALGDRTEKGRPNRIMIPIEQSAAILDC